MSDDKELLIKEAANLIGYHPEALRFLVRHGKIPASKPGMEYRIRYGDLKRFVREHRNARVRELVLD